MEIQLQSVQGNTQRAQKNSPNPLTILNSLYIICRKYAGVNGWAYAGDFGGLAEEIRKDLENGSAKSKDADFWLDEFYDLCDQARVWLEV